MLRLLVQWTGKYLREHKIHSMARQQPEKDLQRCPRQPNFGTIVNGWCLNDACCPFKHCPVKLRQPIFEGHCHWMHRILRSQYLTAILVALGVPATLDYEEWDKESNSTLVDNYPHLLDFRRVAWTRAYLQKTSAVVVLKDLAQSLLQLPGPSMPSLQAQLKNPRYRTCNALISLDESYNQLRAKSQEPAIRRPTRIIFFNFNCLNWLKFAKLY